MSIIPRGLSTLCILYFILSIKELTVQEIESGLGEAAIKYSLEKVLWGKS